jgi:protein phosphatase
MAVATRQWHRTLLRESDLHFLRRMPIIHSTIADGKSFWLAHASPSGALTRYMNAEEVIAASADIDAEVILVGHTHLPYLREVNGKTFCNPGSVGLARNRGGEAEYAVWKNGKLLLKRAAYDVAATVARLEQAPLDKEIVEALRNVLMKQY